MKLTITLTTKKTDGPTPTFEALKTTLEEELDGHQFEAQNDNSDQISLFEISDVVVERR
jgi:hypothetical protein